jgi:dehydrogenase/reductase SDR family protein 4
MINKKVSLITGSTVGIGLSIAEKLGLQGHTVIISSRKEENSMRAEIILKENSIDYDYFMCNFDIKEQRLQLFEYIKNKYGKLDSLVCTVSVSPYIGESLSISENEFDKIFRSNVKNTFFTIVDFLELLKKSKKSTIVILSSHSGYSPFPFLGVYSISKSAIFMMTRVLAEELAKYKIRVNCIAPGYIQTRMNNSKIFNKFAEFCLIKRLGMPHEISGLAAFLCSDEAEFINAEVISVNGGLRGRF